MNKCRSRLLAAWMAALATTVLLGCETGFVADAARESLATFVTGVVDTAVEETINP